MVLEVWALYGERGRQDSNFATILDNFQEINRTVTAAFVAEGKVRTAEAAGVPTVSLKHRALALSDEILRFLVDRQAHEPALLVEATPALRLPALATWSRDTAAALGYMGETMTRYSREFAPRVIASREEFAKQSVTDPEFDRYYEHPTNPIGIRIVGERLGALAERLP
jgi:uncharacterized protein YdcH (DUF465 family)